MNREPGTVEHLVSVHGLSGKLVRAICHLRGWRYVSGQPPEEWYAAWRAGLGAEIEEVVRTTGSTRSPAT